MVGKITVAIEVAEVRAAKALLEICKTLPEVETWQWFNGAGEKGDRAVKGNPDIIVIDDQPETSRSVVERVFRLQENFPHTAIFVVSSNTRPEHIVEMMKAGVAQYLVEPVEIKVLTDAIQEVRVKMTTSGRIALGKVYSFISSKGGVGATVIAVNSSVALLRKEKKKVALYDMSLQSGDASVLLDSTPQTTIMDLCRNIHRLDVSFLRSAMSHHPCGLEFLPAPKDPEESEDVAAGDIARIIDLSRQLYDITLIDCTSMRVDDRSVEIFKHSDQVFVVSDLSIPAVRNATRLCQLIERVGIPPAKIEIVVNRFVKGGILSIEEIETTLKRTIWWLFPNDFNDIVSSINKGEPLVLQDPHAPFSKNVYDFAHKLSGARMDDHYRGIRSTFGKPL